MQGNKVDHQAVSAAWDMLAQAEAVFFDLDGCVYFGERLAEGAKQVLDLLHAQGKQVRFVTNNSTDSGAQVAARLARMGLDVKAEDVMTATELVGLHLRKLYGSINLKVLGSQSLHTSLEQAGHRLLPLYSTAPIDRIVIGRDVTFDYDKLQTVLEEMDRGTPVLATNPDMYHPGSRGKVPETGALYAPLEAITGQTIESFGKPAPHMFQLTMEQCGLSRPEACVMVGDNLLTDIAGGRAANMRTLWLYGASGGSSEVPAGVAGPDCAVASLHALALAL